MAVKIEGLVIRERRLDDDEAIVAIRNEAHVNWPPITLERYRFQADPSLVPSGRVSERFVAEIDGEVEGIYAFGGDWSFERPHTFNGNIGVKESHRRRGIGSRLYEHLLDRARLHEANRLYATIIEGREDGIRFVTNRGFQPSGRVERMSRLEVATANLDGSEGVEERLARDDIRVQTVGEVGPDDGFLHRLYDMEFAAAKDIPSSEEWRQDPFDTWKRWVLEAPPGHAPDRIWVAMHGDEPVGLAALGLSSPTVASNGLTATAREYRGKGIARALKRRQIEWCRENGIEYIYTGNDVDNARMLDINIRLGYKPVPNQIEMVKDL